MQLTIALKPARLGRAERQAEDGAQVVLELAGLGAFDRPVARVVDARRDLVREQLAVDVEQLDGEHADVVELVEERARDARRRRLGARREPGRGRAVTRRMPSACSFSTSG